MGVLHRFALLCGIFLLCLGQVQAAGREKDDSKAAISLLEKALAYYHENGDKAFARSAARVSLSTRTVMSSCSTPRA